MRKVSVLTTLLLALFAFTALLVTAEEGKETVKHEFAGADKCKTCHKPIHTSWETTAHAKAYTVLSDEEKKKAECVGCHITGNLADGTLLEGIQCEACHGAGADYKSPKIKSKKKWTDDPEGSKKEAMAAGLIYPTAENCVRCHKKEGNPNFKEFDFEKMKGKIHPVAAEVPAGK